MGFNKRFINKKNLELFKKQELSSLINYITNPDCLFIEDDFSQKVCKIVGETKNREIMYQKLTEIGFYESK